MKVLAVAALVPFAALVLFGCYVAGEDVCRCGRPWWWKIGAGALSIGFGLLVIGALCASPFLFAWGMDRLFR